MNRHINLLIACLLCLTPTVFAANTTSVIEPAFERAANIKKKIVIAQFDVSNMRHVEDLNNIYDGLPNWLNDKLQASGSFISSYSQLSIPVGHGESQRNIIKRIAEEAGAQLLLAGNVNSARIFVQRGLLGTTYEEQRYRDADIDLVVYDGATGERLWAHNFNKRVNGLVYVGRDKPFASTTFLATEYGKTLDQLLNEATQSLRRGLINIPFVGHITRIAGKRIVIDAGNNVALTPGDSLLIYKRGVPGDNAVDTAVIKFVQAQLSIAELNESPEQLGIKVGDLVKSDPIEQHRLVHEKINAEQLAHAKQEEKEKADRIQREENARLEAEKQRQAAIAAAEAERIKAEKKAAAERARLAALEKQAAEERRQQLLQHIREKNIRDAKNKANNYNKHLNKKEIKTGKKKDQKTSPPPIRENVSAEKINELPFKLKKIEEKQPATKDSEHKAKQP